jgi:hypothetical protein
MKPSSLLERLGLAPIFNLIEQAYLSWALREICPLHPDVPRIVHRLNELQRSA